MKSIPVLLLLFMSNSLLGQPQSFDDVEQAFERSRQTKRPVLLIFSGSDWCAPCIRFQMDILASPEFESFAATQLVLLEADFPQRSKLSQKKQIQNDSLAQQYNPSGQFPHVVLLRSDRSVMTTLLYQHQNARQFITMLERYTAE